jgi:hypothetical protein
MRIITHSIDVPLWRARQTRDVLWSTLLRSAELTAVPRWSWRRPLTMRFIVTGPMFQVHKAIGDVEPLGTVTYA